MRSIHRNWPNVRGIRLFICNTGLASQSPAVMSASSDYNNNNSITHAVFASMKKK